MQTSSAIARQTPQTQLSNAPKNELETSLQRLRTDFGRREAVKAKLASCCLDRGEAMDEIRLGSYSQALVESFTDDADTLTVLDRLSMTARAEYEPIIPAKSELILLVKKEDWARKRKAREECEAQEERDYAARVEAERAAGTFEHLDLTDTIQRAMADKERRAEVEGQQARAYRPTLTPLECPHCGNPTSPDDSVSLYRLAAYYTRKAEIAVDRENALAHQGDTVQNDSQPAKVAFPDSGNEVPR
jgi:hypothetical protein